METANTLTRPEELLERPGLADKVHAAARARGDARLPGPSRDQLLEIVSSAGAPAAAG